MRNFGLGVILGIATCVLTPAASVPAAAGDKCVALTTGGVHPFCTTVYPSSAGDPSSSTPTNFGPGNSFQLLTLTGTFSCPGKNFIEVNFEGVGGSNKNQWYGRVRSGYGKNVGTGVLYKWALVAGGCPASARAAKGTRPLVVK
jgi:hypothetical protein